MTPEVNKEEAAPWMTGRGCSCKSLTKEDGDEPVKKKKKKKKKKWEPGLQVLWKRSYISPNDV